MYRIHSMNFEKAISKTLEPQIYDTKYGVYLCKACVKHEKYQ